MYKILLALTLFSINISSANTIPYKSGFTALIATSTPSRLVFYYGLKQSAMIKASYPLTLKTTHIVSVSELIPNVPYFYQTEINGVKGNIKQIILWVIK